MKELNKFFNRSIKWISFEAISYQLILLVHQFFLFRASNYKMYGLVGLIFSVVYFFVILTDLGLEMSISPFFSSITKSKTSFTKFISKNLLINIISIVIIFFAFLWIKVAFDKSFITLGLPLLFVLAILVLSENIKKTLRTIMHLAFLNSLVAFIELGTIISYTISVWIFYFIGFHISLNLIFLPMMITSSISTILMGYFLYCFSLSLPSQKNLKNSCLSKRVIKSRLFNYTNLISHQLFSSNFWIPFFALQFGLAYVGLFKLTSHIAYCASTILRKTFGLTSDALLAKTKEMTLDIKRSIFLRVTQNLNHAIYGIVIFLAVNYNKILAYKNLNITQSGSVLIYLFLIICLSENLFITYEKFYITQEQSWRLFIFNMITMLLTYGTIQISTNFSPISALVSIILIRIITFGVLGIISFYTWKIKPQLKPKFSYIAISIFASIGFFFLI